MRVGLSGKSLSLVFSRVTLEPLTARAERHGRVDAASLDQDEIAALRRWLGEHQGRFRAHVPIPRFERFELELLPAGHWTAMAALRIPPHVALSSSAIVGGVDDVTDERALTSLAGIWQQVYGGTLGRTVTRLDVHERPAIVSLPLPGSLMHTQEADLLVELQTYVAAAVFDAATSEQPAAGQAPASGSPSPE